MDGSILALWWSILTDGDEGGGGGGGGNFNLMRQMFRLCEGSPACWC